MAIMRGGRIVRGKLGDTGHRQQFVKESDGSYRKRTVAFLLPESNTSNSPLQARQRTRFALISALASAFAKNGLLRTFYRTIRGLSGYNGFTRDALNTAVVESNGEFFVNWPKLRAANGDFAHDIQVFQSDIPAASLAAGEVARKLAWNYEALNAPEDAHDYLLMIYAVKINEDGSIEGVDLVQPLHRMTECSADVILKDCNCCKTFFYGFFANPTTGYFSTSSYLGSTETALAEIDPNCFVCDVYVPENAPVIPSEEIDQCCGKEGVDKASIVFNGTTDYSAYGRPLGTPQLIIPGDEPVTPPATICVTHPATLNQSGLYATSVTPSAKIDPTTDAVVITYGSFKETFVLADYADVQELQAAINAAASGSAFNVSDITGDLTNFVIDFGTTETSFIPPVDVVVNIERNGTQVSNDAGKWSLFATIVTLEYADLAQISQQTVTVDATTAYSGDNSVLSHTITPGSNAAVPRDITAVLENSEADCPNETVTYSYNAGTGLYDEV